MLLVLHTRAQVRIPTTDELAHTRARTPARTRTHAGAHLRLLTWHLFLAPSGFTPVCWRDYEGSVSSVSLSGIRSLEWRNLRLQEVAHQQ